MVSERESLRKDFNEKLGKYNCLKEKDKIVNELSIKLMSPKR